MKKANFFSRFNFFSIIYLIISFCFLFRLPFFFNWTNLLFTQLSYVTISAIFSFFILSFVIIFLKKIKTRKIQKPYHLPIKLNLFHLLALAIWVGEIFFQLYSSLFGITSGQLFFQNFLVDQTLNNLLIAQLSMTIYLLVFIFSTFILGLVFTKSKLIIIKFSKVQTNFFWLIKMKKAVKIQKEWFLFSIHQLFYFLRNFARDLYWTRQVVGLKIKTIQSEFLKNQKKQTTPPLFSF